MKKKCRARRFSLGSYKEYSEQTWDIIDRYLEEHQLELNVMLERGQHYSIRVWLHNKEKWLQNGGKVSEEIEDYYFKFVLGIVPFNEKYNEVIRMIKGLEPKNRTCIALNTGSMN